MLETAERRPADGRSRFPEIPGVAALVAASVATASLLAPSISAAQETMRPTAAVTAECPETVSESSGTWIVGTVRDAASDVLMPGARVTLAWEEDGQLERLSTAASRTGEYRFCGVPPGLHLTLRAEAAGRQGGMYPVDTRAGQPVVRQDLEFALTETGRGSVVGRVVDRSSGRGVEAATLRLEPLGRAVTTRYDGRFVLEGLPAGDYTFQIRHVAYGEHETDVTVPAWETVELEMVVSEEAVEMEPLEVTVSHRYRRLERRGFYERMHWADAHGGEFITPKIIEQRKPARLSHLLSHVPRVNLVNRCQGSVCGFWPRIRPCGSPTIFLDGTRFRVRSVRGIDEIPMGDVRAVEIYMGPSELPMEFSSPTTRCAIAVWTKMGPDRR